MFNEWLVLVERHHGKHCILKKRKKLGLLHAGRAAGAQLSLQMKMTVQLKQKEMTSVVTNDQCL